MSCAKYMSFVLVAGIAAVLVSARPSPAHRSLVLDQVANMSVCPIEVVIDDVPERVPRRIKFIKCAAETPNRLCTEHNMSHGCCKRHHHTGHGDEARNFMTECVEVHDWVQVSYENNPELSQVQVPVGCACVILEPTTPSEIS